MPELPEVETLRLQLESEIVGLVVKEIQLIHPKVFSGNVKEVVGNRVREIKRYGKMLVIVLDKNLNLGVHLKMTGRLIYQKIRNSKFEIRNSDWEVDYSSDKHTHVVITFSDGSKLYFWDVRRFGWMKIISNIKNPASPAGRQIAKLGIEPFTPNFTLENFEKVLETSKKAVKVLLMDQQKISGVGNIYANEALFMAKINPGRPANKLSGKEVKRLHSCVIDVLEKGLKYQGASDNDFRDLFGGKGKFQNHFLVYGRDGEPCLNKCGGQVKRIVLGGRGTFFCSHCQS